MTGRPVVARRGPIPLAHTPLSLQILTIASVSRPAGRSQTCKAKAAQQELTGEALVKFVKQCETDAYMACAETAHKMLAAPANDRVIHMCVVKAVGAGAKVQPTLLQDQFRLHRRCWMR